MKINSSEITNIEPIKTIAVSHIGDYAKIGSAFEKLTTWASANNLWAAAPRMAAVYHDNPQEVAPDNLRSDACLEDLSGIEPAEGMRTYTLSGGKYYIMQVEVVMDEYYEAWQKAYATLKEQGHECDTRDHFEIYVSCSSNDVHDPNAAWVVDLCIPVK